jgi:hypothetical protein
VTHLGSPGLPGELYSLHVMVTFIGLASKPCQYSRVILLALRPVHASMLCSDRIERQISMLLDVLLGQSPETLITPGFSHVSTYRQPRVRQRCGLRCCDVAGATPRRRARLPAGHR